MKRKFLHRVAIRLVGLLAVLMMIALSGLSFQALAQDRELSLADILIALRSKKAVIEEKNRILADAVKERGITFSLTSEIEKELDSTGAQPTLIAAIRQKTPQAKVEAKPQPVVEMPPSKTEVPVPDPSPAPPDFALYRLRATQALAVDDLDAAMLNLDRASELKPTDATTFADRGVIYLRRKNNTEAIEQLTKAVEIDPKDSASYFNRGMAQERLGKPDDALADFERALSLDPTDEPAKTSVARIRKFKSDAEEAARLAALAKAEAMKPPVPETVVPSNTVLNVGTLNDHATRLAMPIYPHFEKRARIQGTVIVLINLDIEGKVTHLECVVGPKAFWASAENAIKQSQFKPVIRDGRAIAASGTISFNFKL
ncbi:MAG: TonB family protein [Pyrinomonadaceae bacterium]